MDNESTPLPVANVDAVGTASETDPRANGVMRGSPPPEDKRVLLSTAPRGLTCAGVPITGENSLRQSESSGEQTQWRSCLEMAAIYP